MPISFFFVNIVFLPLRSIACTSQDLKLNVDKLWHITALIYVEEASISITAVVPRLCWDLTVLMWIQPEPFRCCPQNHERGSKTFFVSFLRQSGLWKLFMVSVWIFLSDKTNTHTTWRRWNFHFLCRVFLYFLHRAKLDILIYCFEQITRLHTFWLQLNQIV